MALVIFPDCELYLTGYLRGAFAARTEPYSTGVKVSNTTPAVMPDRLVTVRRDGGPQLDVVRDAARIGVNVWAKTDQDVADLARLTRALIWACPDGQPVCRVDNLTGPSPIPDPSGKPHRYITCELIIRGSDVD